jgi:hypothetical protein
MYNNLLIRIRLNVFLHVALLAPGFLNSESVDVSDCLTFDPILWFAQNDLPLYPKDVEAFVVQLFLSSYLLVFTCPKILKESELDHSKVEKYTVTEKGADFGDRHVL